MFLSCDLGIKFSMTQITQMAISELNEKTRKRVLEHEWSMYNFLKRVSWIPLISFCV